MRSDHDDAAVVDAAVTADLEFHTAVLTRNLELLRRRSDIYDRIDRSEYLLLRTLDAAGPSDIGSLAAALGLDPSTAGRQVATMTEQGLVKRSPHPSDRRRAVITPTGYGRRLMNAVRERRLEATADLLAAWTPRERRELATLLAKYNDTVASAYLRRADERGRSD